MLCQLSGIKAQALASRALAFMGPRLNLHGFNRGELLRASRNALAETHLLSRARREAGPGPQKPQSLVDRSLNYIGYIYKEAAPLVTPVDKPFIGSGPA